MITSKAGLRNRCCIPSPCRPGVLGIAQQVDAVCGTSGAWANLPSIHTPPPKRRMCVCRASDPLRSRRRCARRRRQAAEWGAETTLMQMDARSANIRRGPHRSGAPDRGTRTILSPPPAPAKYANSLRLRLMQITPSAARLLPWKPALTSSEASAKSGAAPFPDTPPSRPTRVRPRAPRARSGSGVPGLRRNPCGRSAPGEGLRAAEKPPSPAARHPRRRRHPTLLED